MLHDEYSDRSKQVVEALRWLDCGHLPEDLFRVALPFSGFARVMLMHLKDGDQLVRGLHHLVEAKDCFVRQAVFDREQKTS
jgi:hypothetical protein